MAHKPIFIHSLFRTGSTYVWNKFRQSDRYCCYYEPLHHIFSKVDTGNLKDALTKDFKAVRHPNLDKYYLFEYEQAAASVKQSPGGDALLTPVGETGTGKGMPFFKKPFSFAEFCHTGDNPDLKRYIDFLITAAGDKIPLFQFNRSSLRTGWFRDNYPGSLNLYLLRNPRHQWQSYIELYERTKYLSFFVMDLLIAGINEDCDCFRVLSRHVPLIKYNDVNINHEISFYQLVKDAYSPEEQYMIFYYIWFLAFIENVCRADDIININLLCDEDSRCREAVSDLFKKWGIHDVDFADCSISTYSHCALPPGVMEDIESSVQKMLLAALSPEKFDTLLERLSPAEAGYFGFSREKFLQFRSAKLKIVTTPRQTAEKYRQMVVTTAKELFRSVEASKQQKSRLLVLQGIQGQLEKSREQLKRARNKIKELDRQLTGMNRRLEEKEVLRKKLVRDNRVLQEQISVMRDSLSWKLTAPLRALAGLLKPGKKNSSVV